MAIEIREIVIRANIVESQKTKTETQAPVNRRQLVEECVRRVMNNLKKQPLR